MSTAKETMTRIIDQQPEDSSFDQLLRELAVQNQVFIILTAQLEQARLREAMDTPTVQLLDPARAPDRRSWPRRGLIALFGAFIGTLLGYAQALGKLPRFGRRS